MYREKIFKLLLFGTYFRKRSTLFTLISRKF